MIANPEEMTDKQMKKLRPVLVLPKSVARLGDGTRYFWVEYFQRWVKSGSPKMRRYLRLPQ